MNFPKEQFSRAEALWREWNEKINVVSRKDIDSLYDHHILHSLAIAEYLSRTGEDMTGKSVLDVGTGGGFPGIPLAMVFPQSSFTLCDSIGKKIRVASAVVAGLGLKNAECVNCRAESLERSYDWVVSRAVTALDEFYPWVSGKFTKGILYLKGGDLSVEISNLCRKFGVDKGKISVWPVSEWLSEDYFAEKFVIDIRK